MTSATPTVRRSVAELVGEVAGAYIDELQRGYREDLSSAVATLAQLRRGAGKLIEDAPELWGVCGIDRLHAEQKLFESEAEKAEAALFLAVTLYALHQQSHRTENMHCRRREGELGAAVRRLMPKGEIDEPIRRRFVRLGTATTLDALAYRLREIISLLRGKSIPLDYALLARQLYQAQFPDGLREVRQHWGRSFHAYRPETSPDSGEADDTEKDM